MRARHYDLIATLSKARAWGVCSSESSEVQMDRITAYEIRGRQHHHKGLIFHIIIK